MSRTHCSYCPINGTSYSWHYRTSNIQPIMSWFKRNFHHLLWISSYLGYLGNFASGFEFFWCKSLQKAKPFRNIWVTFPWILGCKQNGRRLSPPTSRSYRCLLLISLDQHEKCPEKYLWKHCRKLIELWSLKKIEHELFSYIFNTIRLCWKAGLPSGWRKARYVHCLAIYFFPDEDWSWPNMRQLRAHFSKY